MTKRVCGEGDMHGKGRVCMAGGMYGGGMHDRWHVWQGACMAVGVCVGGGAWQEKTVTAADSTHPTGVHSCLLIILADTQKRSIIKQG